MRSISIPHPQISRTMLIAVAAFAVLFWHAMSGHAVSLPFAAESSFNNTTPVVNQPVKVVSEQSVTVDTVKKVGPSVVTVVGTLPEQQNNYPLFFTQDQTTQSSRIIGSGFIVSTDGLIVTNKHVVSDTSAHYQIITADDKKYDIQTIYRDPQNDIAILKMSLSQNSGTLRAVTLGDSSHLQVGQYTVAIGTALGELRNTVTTGIISGLGRGIQAGDVYQGAAEDLNGLIQTSAAINEGNSGGPLINDTEQVIGINTAVAANGQNVGFALPISVVKQALTNYHLSNGQ